MILNYHLYYFLTYMEFVYPSTNIHLDDYGIRLPDNLFEGPVSDKTKNESVATSYTSERKDYSNSEGRRLLAHINNSSNENNDTESAFVAGRSQDSRDEKTDESSTNNLVKSSREEKQQATVPVLVSRNKEQSSSAELQTQQQHQVDV